MVKPVTYPVLIRKKGEKLLKGNIITYLSRGHPKQGTSVTCNPHLPPVAPRVVVVSLFPAGLMLTGKT